MIVSGGFLNVSMCGWLFLLWIIAMEEVVLTPVWSLLLSLTEEGGGTQAVRLRRRPSVQERFFALMFVKARVWGQNPVIIRKSPPQRDSEGSWEKAEKDK